MPKVVGTVSVEDMRAFPKLVLPLMLSVATLAGACQCGYHAPGRTIREVRSSYIGNLNDQDVIIEGVVERQVLRSDGIVQLDQMWQNYRRVTVRATAVYRGPNRERFEINTGLGGGDCGFDFETGETYLIYAHPKKGSTLLITSICSETKAAEYAGPDLRILRGDPPVAEDSMDVARYQKQFWGKYASNVCGRVTWGDGTPVDGASIRLVRERRDNVLPPGYPTQDWNAVSKPDGSYCLEYVPRGQYLLLARQDIEIDDTRYVGELSRWWRPMPVRVESGKPLSGLTIVLHRDLLYMMRRHALVGSLLTFGLIVSSMIFWRWRMRGQPTSRLT